MEDSYYKRNKEKILAKVKEYQSTRKEYYKQKYREWYAENKEEVNRRRKVGRMTKPKLVVAKKKKEKKKESPVIILPTFVEPEIEEIPREEEPLEFIVSFE